MKKYIYLFSISIIALSARSNTLHVPSQFATIQSAIVAALPGDTVLVTPNALYVENIDFLGKDITVRTPNPATDRFNTLIDGSGNGSVAKFVNNETNYAKLEGFTLINGTGTSRSWWYYLGFSVVSGGGILCDSPIAFNQSANPGGSSPTLENLIIQNNEAEFGGGICAWKTSRPVIKNCIIRNNNAYGVGGGCMFIEAFNVATGSPVYLENVEITHNTSNGNVGGSGLVVNYTSKAVLMNCTISDNTATVPSGENLFRANGAMLEIHNSIIYTPNGNLLYDQGGTSTQSTIDYSCANNFLGPITNVAGNITANPDFVNPVNNDYHLLSSSSCIDAGTTINAPAIDLDSNLRDALPDMGAFEFPQTPVTVVANFYSTDTIFCEKQCIDFFDLSTNSPTSWQWYFTGAVPDTSTLQNPTGICYNTYGSFDVMLIACNATGCDTIEITNFITELINPVDSIYGSNDTLWSLPFVTYQWYELTSGLIPGATQQYFVPTQSGSYYCIVSDTNGCVATSNTFVITGVNDYDGQHYFNLHPNPNNGSFTITGNSKYLIEKIDIHNSVGGLVYSHKPFAFNSFIQAELSAGIYFVSVSTSKQTLRKKIMVE